ncbi:MAG: DUF4330 domain-containing protein [Oscillospiraceae bacterium]|jgi:hypothetical protein|nr:DUF4330 domain-containing protein [Oscillospiraceae bacterium]
MKKKVKLRLNAVDAVIIVLALALGLVGYKLLSSGGSLLSSGKQVTLHYTVELTYLPEGVAELVHVGDEIMEIVEKHTIGKILSVTVEPYREATHDYNTGDWVMHEVPGRETAIVELALRVTDDGKELTANGFTVRIGTVLPVAGPRWACARAIVIGIDRDLLTQTVEG